MVEIKVGLEVHGYLDMIDTGRKLFCNCQIKEDSEPNTNICPTCTGQPGSKPMLPNEEAIKKIVAIAKMLNCKINHNLVFQRKHYDWPDMPTGYQRTMSGSFAVPVGEHGEFEGIRITEIHLEEDPAAWDPLTGRIDYNRAGHPLVEIVTEPDFRSSQQVRDWLKKLLTILSYIKAVNENAGVKADVNVSIFPKFERVEIKNVNSLKSIAKAVEYETARQEKEVSEGKRIVQETRRWDDKKEETQFMRSKEQAQDYMFIPEPDLPIIEVTPDYIKLIEESLPQKPQEKIEKFTKRGVEKEDAEVLASELQLAELFEKVAAEIDPQLAAKWLRRELLRVLNYNKKTLDEVKIDEKHIIELLSMLHKKEISDKVARTIIEKLIEKGFSPREYVQKEGLHQVSDKSELEAMCKQAIEENPKAVADIKAGNEKSVNFIVGQVMRKTKGKSNPVEVGKLIKELISQY
jgi:aspartyl-tRNA(Asn)/glutamyl-tRNA(Gln) amidotransferase subunit B